MAGEKRRVVAATPPAKPTPANGTPGAKTPADVAPHRANDHHNSTVVTRVDGEPNMTVVQSQPPATLDRPKRWSCFVIMPSGNHGEYKGGARESDFIFQNIIVPAVMAACANDVRVVREADASTSGAIDRRIVEHTASADLAIVDITGQNPNVFFELGMRYVLKRSTTILLRQADTNIPFDITSYRCVLYDPKWDGARVAQERIREAVSSAIQGGPGGIDTLVYNVYPRLSINLNPGDSQPGHERDRMSCDVYLEHINRIEQLLRGSILDRDRMSWEEYSEQINRIQEMLRQSIVEGKYRPQALLGLSNGGMLVADLIGRHLFGGRPIASLWVDRHGSLFENALNEAVVIGLRKFAPRRGPMELLLVDDIVASGQTIRAAINYLSEHLPNTTLRFLPIFSGNADYASFIQDIIVWKHDAFRGVMDRTPEGINSIHRTRYRKLPYDKAIRSS